MSRPAERPIEHEVTLDWKSIGVRKGQNWQVLGYKGRVNILLDGEPIKTDGHEYDWDCDLKGNIRIYMSFSNDPVECEVIEASDSGQLCDIIARVVAEKAHEGYLA